MVKGVREDEMTTKDLDREKRRIAREQLQKLDDAFLRRTGLSARKLVDYLSERARLRAMDIGGLGSAFVPPDDCVENNRADLWEIYRLEREEEDGWTLERFQAFRSSQEGQELDARYLKRAKKRCGVGEV
jgi:hypothetical protein